MRGARPKDPGRPVGLSIETREERHKQSSNGGRQPHSVDRYVNNDNQHRTVTKDGNIAVAEIGKKNPTSDREIPRGLRKVEYNGNGGRQSNNARKSTATAFNLQDLRKILEMQSPSQAVQILSDWSERLNALLNDHRMSGDVIDILLRLFVRVFECKESVTRSTVVDIVKDSVFLKKVLVSYVTYLEENLKIKAQNETQIVRQIEMHVHLLLKFLKGLIPKIEGETNDIAMNITLLDVKSKELFERRRLSKKVLIDVVRFKKESDKYIAEAKEEVKRRRQRASAVREGIFDGPPPDDYRDIPILPTKDDLHSTELPFLRPNITKGSYSNQFHYLDVQFRLLREDFVSPLRDGIQAHIADVINPLPRNKRKRNTDVRVYYDVRIENPVFSEKGVLYRVSFSLRNLKHVKWETNNKLLIFGSLVCLSHDNFQTLLFGTVGDRKPDLLSDGKVDIRLQNIEMMDNTRVYTMVESTAFYESYRPVLQVLQQFDEDTIPMENYIIRASHSIEQPQYLIGHNRSTKSINVRMPNRSELLYDISALMKSPRNNAKKINILDENAWPELDQLMLDRSQLSAVKAALTKELAVIQGPPGTGKTYIGLKIVETLLLNKSLWSPVQGALRLEHGEHTPIMVICYTNHALDQFLGGILEFSPTKIVRIGGRSKSEKLEQFNMNRLSRHYKRRKEKNFEKLRESISGQMIRAEEMINLCSKHIVSELSLRNHIHDCHFKDLLKLRKEYALDDMRSTMPTWLGLLSNSGKPDITGHDTLMNNISSPDDVEEEEKDNVPNSNNIRTELDMLLHQREMGDASEKKDYEGRKESIIASLSQKLAYEPNMKCKNAPLKENRKSMLQQLSVTDDKMTEHEVNSIVNIRRLSTKNRWRLYRYWIAKYKVELRGVLFDKQKAYDQLICRKVQQQNHEANCKVLRHANVIGMTTTGAAMNKELLNDVRPRIVVVEEAAEILEAHIVTSLTQQCEHLILIGDHQQLKPNPTVYKLATKFNLDTSLFERMLTNGVPCQKLSSQHRMRPEISNIMRTHFYSHLLDDESVKHIGDVIGVRHNLFFINHDCHEDSVEDMMSKSNVHEAEYCVALAKYFFQQGYETSLITILTTYSGQVLNFRRILKNEEYKCLRGIYVSPVDNYQGEENEIILLSLVRSNEAGNIGFLKVSNRMCVALSRARKGLFCIGNFKLLAERNDLWMKIVTDMRSSGRVGNHLELYCNNHPERKVQASTAKDFDQCPRGGCQRMCETRLDCGHVCPLVCHPKDPHHEKYDCMETCVRKCERGHSCNSRCFEKCHPCNFTVNRTLDCNHDVQIQCYQFGNPIDCTNPCDRPLKCGHECENRCFENCTSKCLEIVPKSFLPCGHNIEVECFIRTCQVPCEQILGCCHGCREKCGDTCTVECTEIIKKIFECGHAVSVPCFTPTCTLPCPRERTCGHPCPKHCGESCGECLVKVNKKLQCGHHELLPCHMDVLLWSSIKHCKQECLKNLSCGHPCPKHCGDSCGQCLVKVNKTLKCGHDELLPCHMDVLVWSKRRPCIQECMKTLSCGHPCKLDCWKPCSVSQCAVLVKRKLRCKHEKDLPCHVIPEKIYKYVKELRIHTAGYDVRKQVALMICRLEVTVTRKCGHDTTVECCKTSKIEETECLEKVVESLLCGHDVTRKCSEIGICGEKCSKELPCGHSCKKTCAEPCADQCNEKVEKKLSCGHMKTVRCCLDVTNEVTVGETACRYEIPVQLPCGHKSTQICCQRDLPITCKTQCTKKLPCGHPCTKVCSEDCSVDACTLPCNAVLSCRHVCTGMCRICSYGRVHATCSKPTLNKLVCGHVCKQTCSIIPCQPCDRDCNTRCLHRQCRRSCTDICEPCKLPCEWKCSHLKCTNACDEMCNRGRCNRPCRKTLRDCRHKCFGLCGELCLTRCLVCDPRSYHPVKYVPAKAGSRPKYVFLYDCSHAIEVSEMDAYMDKDEGIRQKECPLCHTTIRYNPRYGNVLKAIHMRITTIKRRTHAQQSIQQVQEGRMRILTRLSVLKTIETRRILEEVNSRYGISYGRLLVIDIVITLLETVDRIRINLNLQEDNVSKSNAHIYQLSKVEKKVWNFDKNIPRQTLVDLSSELQRLDICSQLQTLMVNPTSDHIGDIVSKMLQSPQRRLTGGDKLEAFRLLDIKQLDDPLVLAYEIIDSSSSFYQADWSTCSQGHVLRIKTTNDESVQHCEECATSNISKENDATPVDASRNLSKEPSITLVDQTRPKETAMDLEDSPEASLREVNREFRVVTSRVNSTE